MKVICTDCPLLHQDPEDYPSCGLGYDLLNYEETDEEDDDWRNEYSFNCDLVVIKYKDGEYTPKPL